MNHWTSKLIFRAQNIVSIQMLTFFFERLRNPRPTSNQRDFAENYDFILRIALESKTSKRLWVPWTTDALPRSNAGSMYFPSLEAGRSWTRLQRAVADIHKIGNFTLALNGNRTCGLICLVPCACSSLLCLWSNLSKQNKRTLLYSMKYLTLM
jgi:hypothetical protein